MSDRQPLYSFEAQIPANHNKGRKVARRWDKYIRIAIDGEPRTCQQIADLMGMKDNGSVPSFLRSLKFRLIVDETGLRLNVKTGKQGKLIWTLERKTVAFPKVEKEA